MPKPALPVVLCFSGHDPTGGAGIQADIEAIRAQNVHPATVVTALTIQDSRNAYAVEPVDPREVIGQAELMLEDLPVSVIKIGMLGSADNAFAVAALLEKHPRLPVVLDPVLRAGGGAALSDQPLINALMESLLPKTTVLTPNRAELRQLAAPAKSLEKCAATLIKCGIQHVLVTGADDAGEEVTNHLFSAGGNSRNWRWPKLPARYHGSGCTLAASLAARIALGEDVETAADHAQSYTWQTLKSGYRLGRGQHFPQRLKR